MTAFALGLIGDRAAVDALLAALRDPEPVVRARAAEALGQIGDARAAPAVAAARARGRAPRRRAAVTVRGDDPGSAADPWLEAAARPVRPRPPEGRRAPRRRRCSRAARPRFDWWAATWAAMRLESAEPQAGAAGRGCARRTRCRGRWPRAGWARSRIRRTRTRSLPLLRDRDEGVVVNALRAVGALGDPRGVAARGRPCSAPRARPSAWKRCGRWPRCPPDRSLRERIVARAGHDQPAVRAAALLALARLDREDFALVLSSLDPDPAPVGARRPRRRAGRGRATRSASGILLRDAEGRRTRGVLPGVLEAIRKARGADAADTLRRHLEHPDFAVRAAAVGGPGRAQGARPGRDALAPRLRAVAARRRPRRAPRAWSTRWPRHEGRASARRRCARPRGERSRRAWCAPRAAAALRAQRLEAPDPGEVAVGPAAARLPRGHGALRSRARRPALHARAPSCTRATGTIEIHLTSSRRRSPARPSSTSRAAASTTA